MKKTFAAAISILVLGGADLALGQGANRPLSSPTPSLLSAASPFLSATATPSVPLAEKRHPRLYEVQTRIKNQEDRVEQGVRDKTLAGEQAKYCRDIIQAAQTQLSADFANNGNIDLRSDQVVELNTILDANSKIIHEEKQQSATVTATEATTTPTPAAR